MIKGAKPANKPGRKRSAAGMALVFRADRDRRERPATGALRAQDAHASAFSYTTAAFSTVIPTLSYSFVAPVGLSASTPSVTRGTPRA